MIKSITTSLVCAFALFLEIQPASSHGTVSSPPSRIYRCYKEGPENLRSPACIRAATLNGRQPFYDWNSVRQGNANGNHQQVVPNGQLASGGDPGKYGGLDQVRSDWVAEPVSPGPYTVTWTNSAAHRTAYYRVYITNADWNPTKPLTWNSLTLLADTGRRGPENTSNIQVTLPQRTGKHVIYSVWQRSDSPEAFYSASDVEFGNGRTTPTPTPAPTPTPTPAPTPAPVPAPTPRPPSQGSTSWQVGATYRRGDLVTYNGVTYRCLNGHTTQANWTPPAVANLWQQVDK